MASLVLHLSGPFRIARHDGGPPIHLGRRAQGLLAYLCCQEEMRAERALLAALLWSDRGEAQARASLRQELSVLRRTLPEGVLLADRYTVSLAPDEVQVQRGVGPFLQGFDLVSEGFEEWLRSERLAGETAATARPAVEPDRRGRPSLAVLPFEEIGVPDSDMFADGMVEEITGALSRVHAFHVIARQSAYALRNETLPPPEIARRLGARYLLTGSVRRAGKRVRLSTQLVHGPDGRTLWSERFDDRLDDLFDLEDRIAAQVAGHLAPNLRAAEIARAGRRPPESRSAYELVLTALPHFWVHDPEENRRALTLLDAALTQAPDHAPAHAMKAWCHAHECCYLWSASHETDRAAAAASFDAALPRVADHAPSLTALSAASAQALGDPMRSEELARRALALDPNNAWAWLRLGWAVVYTGRATESLEYFDRAEDLSPLDPFLFNIDFGRSCALRTMRRFDEAVALIERGMRAAPKARWANRMLFGALWLAGDREGALAAGRRWLGAHPGLSREALVAGLPAWRHDPAYMDVLQRFDELIPEPEPICSPAR